MEIKVNVNQIPVSVLDEGAKDYPAMSKIGQLFTADWHMRVIMAGLAHRMSFGTITGAANITMVGNNDTTTELRRPEMIVAVDTGYLVPMSVNVGANCDLDADDEEMEVLVTADRTTAVTAADIATATGVAGAPDNLLDGAPAFQGRSLDIATASITAPAALDILYYNYWEALGADPLVCTNFNVDHVWKIPTLLAGPCSLFLYVGGTIDPTFVGSFVFAHIPLNWAPVS